MFSRLLVAAGFAAVLSSAAFGQQATDKEARQAIDEMAKSFQSAYNAGKPESIAALFAKDGVYLTPAGTQVNDPQKIQAAVAARINAGWTRETVNPNEAHAAGNAAWGYGDYSLMGTGANEGRQIAGKYAMFLTRDGGDWRIALLIGNLKPTQDVTGQGAVAKTQ
jgi:ketosteroid isomerase-like protein